MYCDDKAIDYILYYKPDKSTTFNYFMNKLHLATHSIDDFTFRHKQLAINSVNYQADMVFRSIKPNRATVYRSFKELLLVVYYYFYYNGIIPSNFYDNIMKCVIRGDIDWDYYDCMLQLVERFDMDLHKPPFRRAKKRS